MKHHHCHCDLHAQFKKFRAKKLGLLGAALMVGHILFHVVECLVLPAILVGFSGHHDNHAARAEGARDTLIAIEELFFVDELSATILQIDLQKYGVLGLNPDFRLTLPALPQT